MTIGLKIFVAVCIVIALICLWAFGDDGEVKPWESKEERKNDGN